MVDGFPVMKTPQYIMGDIFEERSPQETVLSSSVAIFHIAGGPALCHYFVTVALEVRARTLIRKRRIHAPFCGAAWHSLISFHYC